ncbi:nucleolar protein 58-like protein [Tanacetum coccineum]
MSCDVIMVGSTMWIPLLYRDEYSQWRERFMNYLEEQTYGELLIKSITHGEQSLPVVTQVLLVGTALNAPPVLKDPKLWTVEEKMISLKSCGMHLKGICVVMNMICGYKKDNCELNYKFLNNLLPEWKKYVGIKYKEVFVTSDLLALVAEKTKVSKISEKVVVKSDSKESDDEDINDLKKITTTSSAPTSSNKKLEYVKQEEKKEDKKEDGKKLDMNKVKCYSCKKERHFAKDCKKAKVKDYNYYKTNMLLAKKDNDEQVLLAED